MGETGKRYRQNRDSDAGERSYKRQSTNNDKSSNYGNTGNNDDLVVYRILCQDKLIGSVIGKGGKVINSIRYETNAKIKIVDPFPGSDKRVITIYCYLKDKDLVDVDEEGTRPVCSAQDALLRVHEAIMNAVEMSRDGERDNKKYKEEALILVPASQSASIIGKSGATIKKLRSQTGANIKVSPKDANDATHSCAMSFDNFVSITGNLEAVKKALYAISIIMFKFSPKEEISLDTSVPETPSSIIIPSDVSIFSTSSFYPSADTVVSQGRSAAPVTGATSHVPELHGFSESLNAWPLYASAFPVVPGYTGSSRSEELVVRVLCPSDKIGRVIGKGGSTIKSIRQDSGARIEVDDKKYDGESIITITSSESTGDLKSAAVEAVLQLQMKINDEDEEKVNIRLLVPSKVIGCLIGKSGSIINEMRKKTKAEIRISKGEKPKSISSSDELVEVLGEVVHVRDALAQIVVRLRDDVLRDKDGSKSVPPQAETAYSGALSVPSVLPAVPPVALLGFDQRVEAERGLGLGSLYGYHSLQGGESAYGSLSSGYGSVASYTSKSFAGLPSSFEMLIPANAVGKVMGKGGANIENIRKISGAQIEIVESKQHRSERIAHISGTPEQKRSAENLIQAFIMST